MNREELIANLNMIRVAFIDTVTAEQEKLIDDTFEMAIKALSQEPCEDAISRQQCIDAVNKILAQYVPKIYLYTLPLELEKAITDLPSISTEKTDIYRQGWHDAINNSLKRNA